MVNKFANRCILGFRIILAISRCHNFVHTVIRRWKCFIHDIWYLCSVSFYYMEKSVLLGTKPLVDSIRHFIRDPIGVFSVCHLYECRIVQWRQDSRLLLLLNWFLASRLLFRIKAWRAGLRPSATKKLKSLQKNLKTRTRRRKPCTT